MWWRKPVRPPPSYDNVRSVAEVLSRINADLIQRHFAVSADEARQFMQRLVQECCYEEIAPDRWHYPLTRRQRLWRLRAARKPAMVEDIIAVQPASAEALSKRIDELERERHALRARVKRLQNAGKTVIRQRDEWMVGRSMRRTHWRRSVASR
jgi:polyhydroxyalkanoate synthesis regulator phasin